MPYSVSNPTGIDIDSFRLPTVQIWISPVRAGSPPATASFLPSGENFTFCTRSAIPTSRPASPEPSAWCSSTSWYPATAINAPSGE